MTISGDDGAGVDPLTGAPRNLKHLDTTWGASTPGAYTTLTSDLTALTARVDTLTNRVDALTATTGQTAATGRTLSGITTVRRDIQSARWWLAVLTVVLVFAVMGVVGAAAWVHAETRVNAERIARLDAQRVLDSNRQSMVSTDIRNFCDVYDFLVNTASPYQVENFGPRLAALKASATRLRCAGVV